MSILPSAERCRPGVGHLCSGLLFEGGSLAAPIGLGRRLVQCASVAKDAANTDYTGYRGQPPTRTTRRVRAPSGELTPLAWNVGAAESLRLDRERAVDGGALAVAEEGAERIESTRPQPGSRCAQEHERADHQPRDPDRVTDERKAHGCCDQSGCVHGAR